MIGLAGSPVLGFFGNTKAGVVVAIDETGAGDGDAVGAVDGVAEVDDAGADEAEACTAVDSFVAGGLLHAAISPTIPIPTDLFRIRVLTKRTLRLLNSESTFSGPIGDTGWMPASIEWAPQNFIVWNAFCFARRAEDELN